MEGHCQIGHESQDQGGMGHRQGEMERSLQDSLPRSSNLLKTVPFSINRGYLWFFRLEVLPVLYRRVYLQEGVVDRVFVCDVQWQKLYEAIVVHLVASIGCNYHGRKVPSCLFSPDYF